MSAFRDQVNRVCADLPGACLSDPWGGGHDAWKVGDKMFAAMGAVDPGVSVKCADIDTATMLIEGGIAGRARYFHRSWVRLPEDADPAEIAHRITTSYALVRAKLTKKVQAALPPWPSGAGDD